MGASSEFLLPVLIVLCSIVFVHVIRSVLHAYCIVSPIHATALSERDVSYFTRNNFFLLSSDDLFLVLSLVAVSTCFDADVNFKFGKSVQKRTG